MIPPGLNVKKTPQIKCLAKENKIAWDNSLNKTLKTLLDLLISQHSSDLETINKQLETLKTELYRLNDINNNIELTLFHMGLLDNTRMRRADSARPPVTQLFDKICI